MEVMYSNNIGTYLKENSINGFYKDKNDLMYYLENITGLMYDDEWSVKKFLYKQKKISNDDFYKMLENYRITEDVLNKKIKYLSTNEYKFVLLCALLLENPEVYIFDYFETNLSYKNKKIFINLLKKLKNEGKTVVIVTNNISFILEVCDFVIMIEKRKMLYSGTKNDLFNKNIFEKPPIINFIKKANKKGAKLLWTMDIKELIKDIYRSLK